MATGHGEVKVSRRLAVVGLGYVGLPLALAFGRKLRGVIGFDVDTRRIAALREQRDCTGEARPEDFVGAVVEFTADAGALAEADFFVVAVPTPIDRNNRPDLRALRSATETIGRIMSRGSIVVYESTVFPSATETICGPLLERVSGLRRRVDFALGYSPERINPGDREHSLEQLVKVVSAENDATLDILAEVYGAVCSAGVHRAPSIMVAEAAKVIENTQRDLNIALMNECALIFDRLGICTADVLDVAATKWNFLRFTPGLVGGHCIGVDPYYLTTKAEQLGYQPQVILAGRRINDSMGVYIAQRLVKLLARAGVAIGGAKVGVLGVTFKENVGDVRNSRVPDIVSELRDFGVDVAVHDPLADPAEVNGHYGIELVELASLVDLDALVVAVPHRDYLATPLEHLLDHARPGAVIVDVKSALGRSNIPSSHPYWSL